MRPLHPVPIVFALDHGFFKYCIVSMQSILINSSFRHRFYFLFDSFDPSEVARMRKIADKFDCEIHLCPISIGKYGELKGCAHIPNAAYFRLSLFEEVKADICLYIDVDTLVTIDISMLLATDLKGRALAAVPDRGGAQTAIVPMTQPDLYFNSGVMLIDLQRINSAKILERFVEVYRKNEILIKYADQCVLNIIIDGDYVRLEEKWNFMFSNNASSEKQKDFTVAGKACLLHYSGGCKPWMDWCPDVMTDYWLSYARMAGFDRSEVIVKPRTVSEYLLTAEKHEAVGNYRRSCDIKNIIISHLMKAK